MRKVAKKRAAAMDNIWHRLRGWCSGGGGSAMMVESLFHLLWQRREYERGKGVL